MAKANFYVDLSVTESGRRRPEYTLDSDLKGEMTLKDLLDWTKSTLIVVSDEVLKEEQSNGFDRTPVMLVDGNRRKSPASVSPLGQIEFIARQQFLDVLLEAYLGLLERSKVLKGVYKASHYVFMNGKQVANSLGSLEAWIKTSPDFKERDTIRIVNIQPYARKLELAGITAQRGVQKRRYNYKVPNQGERNYAKVPNGSYQLTTRALKAKYKQNMLIRFSFLPGNELGLAGNFKNGRKGTNSVGRPYLYPSIIFSIQERGIL